MNPDIFDEIAEDRKTGHHVEARLRVRGAHTERYCQYHQKTAPALHRAPHASR